MKHTNTAGLAEPTTRPQIPRHFFLALRVNTKLCDHVYQAGLVPDHQVRCGEQIPPFQNAASRSHGTGLSVRF